MSIALVSVLNIRSNIKGIYWQNVLKIFISNSRTSDKMPHGTRVGERKVIMNFSKEELTI